MTVKQLSVFIENRQGRLGEVLDVLRKNNVSILSMSLADTTEYGLLRLIVNKPEEGCKVLLDAGFSGILTDVIIIKIPHKPGSLQEILSRIAAADINIEYMYGLSVRANDASIVMKTTALDTACKVLSQISVDTMSNEEISNL
jgi:hypothetical protein